ncbi:MAG: glutamate 5-kinase [Pseudomonadota bacterium]
MSRLTPFKRIVIKIGSSLLVDRERSDVRRDWLKSLIGDVADRREAGAEIVIVSSGAIALGRGRLGLPAGVLKLEESQAAAAVGQIALARTYAEHLSAIGAAAGQILLTLSDTEDRRRYLNARSTIETLLRMHVVPVVNENDSVATNEIRYGDNDRLAARVAAMIGADCLILLSDIDGLYSAPPDEDPHVRFIDHVKAITPEIEAMAGGAGSELSRGGMRTKIEAARIATAAGATMVIASGIRAHPVGAIHDGERATWFAPTTTPQKARKAWIGGTLEPRGEITVDDGAASALLRGKSLLPAGVTHITGEFARGDTLRVVNAHGAELARGLSSYDASDMRLIAGRKSSEIEAILGYAGRTALIHRDNLVMSKTTEPVGD